MTPDEKDKWIALIEGVAAGGQLQVRGGFDAWTKADVISIGDKPEHYRIKPREPRSIEGWANPAVFSNPLVGFGVFGEQSESRIRVRITEILE